MLSVVSNMNSETKVCQNCKQDFTIEPDDFAFYEKIKVPPPTFCPECRFERRLTFWNPTNLYHRKCDLCKKDSISMYSPEAPYTVYCPKCWWSDEWDHFKYGRNYDFNRPFFEQLDELWHEVPLLGLSLGSECLDTSPYNNYAGHLKNCYLLFEANFCEDSAYGVWVRDVRRVFDCSTIMLSELCYDCQNCFKSSRCIGSRGNLTESLETIFLRDSDNCQNCVASANLRNKKYYIFNKPYTKDTYHEEMKKWDLGSYAKYEELKQKAINHWKQFPPKPYYSEFATNWSGSYVFQSKNCKDCYEVSGVEDGRYLFSLYKAPIKDCYDVSCWGDNLSLAYECGVVGENVSNIRFCHESGINLYNAEYSKLSTGGSNHLGCVSVRKGDYVILNKRYSPEEFEKLREKIISHMSEMPYTDEQGRIYRYGEFFPIDMDPFAYNESATQKFFPKTKEEIISSGYNWREPEVRKYSFTITADNLPDNIKDVKDSILQEVVSCKTCGRGFRIILSELQFLRQMNLPLPRRCSFCRIEEKFDRWVKNLKVIVRACDTCGATFQTPHTPEDSPHILCKKCYLAEVV